MANPAKIRETQTFQTDQSGLRVTSPAECALFAKARRHGRSGTTRPLDSRVPWVLWLSEPQSVWERLTRLVPAVQSCP